MAILRLLITCLITKEKWRVSIKQAINFWGWYSKNIYHFRGVIYQKYLPISVVGGWYILGLCYFSRLLFVKTKKLQGTWPILKSIPISFWFDICFLGWIIKKVQMGSQYSSSNWYYSNIPNSRHVFTSLKWHWTICQQATQFFIFYNPLKNRSFCH